MKNPQENLAILNIWSRDLTTSTRETTTRAWIYDVRMAQFVLKIEKLSHVMGPRASQDLRSPSPIMAPDTRRSIENILITWRIQIIAVRSVFGRCLFDKQANELTSGKLTVSRCFSSHFPLQKPPDWHHTARMVGRGKLLKETRVETYDDLAVSRTPKLFV